MNKEMLSYPPSPDQNQDDSHSRKILRNTFIFLCVLFFILTLLILMYHNGKSIYDNGI